MTDLDEFKAFFRKKGVDHEYVKSAHDTWNAIWVGEAQLRFNLDGMYIGRYDFDENQFVRRRTAPEGG